MSGILRFVLEVVGGIGGAAALIIFVGIPFMWIAKYLGLDGD